ncbi:MAG: inositol 2-dehydrogenase [Alphaproteobacteria bacterium]
MMINFAILGAGRIGQVHARAVAGNEKARLCAVADPIAAASDAVASRYGCDVRTIDEIAASDDVDAVVICTPTDTHADLIEQFVGKGKAVFCEKPIDLDANRVRACLDVVARESGFLMVGFNRRFDPHFMAVKQAISDGKVGTPELAIITSRDPGAPPLDYINRSGGIFRDMTIHDFDMAMFLMGEMPETVQAISSVLTDPAIEPTGDFDTASVIMRMASGKQVTITNSRRASYGYDQRIEVHGSLGMVSAENQRPTSIEVATAAGFTRPPLHDFFMTRYIDAYANEIDSFITCLVEGKPASPSGQDGLNALLVADAALESVRSGTAVKVAKP